MTVGPVLAIQRWGSNARMIADCAKLGYLSQDWPTMDATYGRGGFWTHFRPDNLVCHDLKLDGVDFRELPEPEPCYRAVTFDPPYKLTGTPASPEMDDRYGTTEHRKRRNLYAMIESGLMECDRVLLPGGFLLFKCQDQVEGGRVRWQTRYFADYLETMRKGTRLVDMMMILGGRPQPPRKRKDGKPSVQQHARRNYSSLLIFQKS